MKKQKQRLDLILIEKNIFETRHKAQASIMSGEVFVNGNKITKPGTLISEEDRLEFKLRNCTYVSRGGLKLEKALETFSINVCNKICLDIGASTGGFTDCLLKNGAAFVYAIDVGYGQLDWKIRNDQRVKVLEKTNIRYLKPDILYNDLAQERATFCTIDVSFISLEKILENIIILMSDQINIVALIKPQFEAGKDQVQKKGVIKEKNVHYDVIKNILDFCNKIELYPIGLSYSPIKGPSGNIEFLIYLTNDTNASPIDLEKANKVVELAHEELGQECRENLEI